MQASASERNQVISGCSHFARDQMHPGIDSVVAGVIGSPGQPLRSGKYSSLAWSLASKSWLGQMQRNAYGQTVSPAGELSPRLLGGNMNSLSVYTPALALVVCASHPAGSLAQSGWFWQNPLPQGNTLFAIA